MCAQVRRQFFEQSFADHRLPQVTAFGYLPEQGRFRLALADGCVLELPVDSFPDLAGLDEAQRSEVTFDPSRATVNHGPSGLALHASGLLTNCAQLVALTHGLSRWERVGQMTGVLSVRWEPLP